MTAMANYSIKQRIPQDMIGQRDETYPTGISAGYPGYTLSQAEEMKKQQENMMKVAKNTLDINVVIEPLHGRNQEGTYCVQNRSTYLKY